jgi:1-acyl-sn-glycerol-3-phosphate acyltransferase
VPPRWVRRPIALLVLAGLVLLATTLPLLLVAATVASLFVPGRWRVLRLLCFALAYLALEVAALVTALVLWVASGFGWALRGPAFQRAHYAVLRALLAAVELLAMRVFRVRVETDGQGWSPLDDGVPGSTNAMVVLSRHAGPGDSFLLVRTLLDRDHLRRPRIVLKEQLQWDPVVDVYLNRLPTAWIPSTGGRTDDVLASLRRLAAGMGEEDALLIFPEGGNFTPRRRARAIERLRAGGHGEHASLAEAMPNVLPPRPGGVQAALAAAPHADVVFVAHTGLEHLSTARDLWAGLPMDTTLRLRWDFVAAADVPRDPAEQIDWLYARWAEVDAWITAQATR